jgi:hypothetical protein
VWPPCKIGEVEIEVVCLCQRVEVRGIELEDIRCVERAQRRHDCCRTDTWNLSKLVLLRWQARLEEISMSVSQNSRDQAWRFVLL